MGEIVVDIDLQNADDRAVFERGYIEASEVRTYRMKAVVDTGAVMLVLPQDVVEQLGLKARRKVIVTYAGECNEARPVAGPLALRVSGREMVTECVVGPPASEALIGQIILEALDLLADCQSRTQHPRPESPIYPLLKLK